MAGTDTSTGYSGTPLARKLGLKPGMRASVIDAPPDYLDWLAPVPEGIVWQPLPGADTELVHRFVTSREQLATDLKDWRGLLRPEAMVWISWPKKASKMPADISEDVIREVCLPLGWVDVKVCAVSAVWSGLKLVVRKALR